MGSKTVTGFRDRCLIPKHLSENCCPIDSSANPADNSPALDCGLSSDFESWIDGIIQENGASDLPGASDSKTCKSSVAEKYGDDAVKWRCSTTYCSVMWDPWIKYAQENSKSGKVPTGSEYCSATGGGVKMIESASGADGGNQTFGSQVDGSELSESPPSVSSASMLFAHISVIYFALT